MSLTVKFLNGLGVTEAQREAILEEHANTVNEIKAERDRLKSDAEKLPAVQKELDDLKAAGDGGYKKKYMDEHQAFEDFKKEQAAKEAHGAKERAYRALLQEVGISDKRIESVLKVSDVDGVELDDKGAVKDAGKLKEDLKTEWADFIVTTTTKGADTATPPAATATKPAANSRAAQIAAEFQKSLYGEIKKE